MSFMFDILVQPVFYPVYGNPCFANINNAPCFPALAATYIAVLDCFYNHVWSHANRKFNTHKSYLWYVYTAFYNAYWFWFSVFCLFVLSSFLYCANCTFAPGNFYLFYSCNHSRPTWRKRMEESNRPSTGYCRNTIRNTGLLYQPFCSNHPLIQII